MEDGLEPPQTNDKRNKITFLLLLTMKGQFRANIPERNQLLNIELHLQNMFFQIASTVKNVMCR